MEIRERRRPAEAIPDPFEHRDRIRLGPRAYYTLVRSNRLRELFSDREGLGRGSSGAPGISSRSRSHVQPGAIRAEKAS